MPIETVQQVVRTLGQAQFAIDPWTDENGVNLGARIHLVVQEPAVVDESATLTLRADRRTEGTRMNARGPVRSDIRGTTPEWVPPPANSVAAALSTKGVTEPLAEDLS